MEQFSKKIESKKKESRFRKRPVMGASPGLGLLGGRIVKGREAFLINKEKEHRYEDLFIH